MNAQTIKQMVAGPAGAIECAIDLPPTLASAPIGTAVLCHPNPQQAGTMDNKVVQTLARAVLQLGWRSVRFNFRGVGASEGAWGDGIGEVDDALAVIAAFTFADTDADAGAAPRFMLGGFSFGAFVASQALTQLDESAKPERLVLIGPSTARQTVPNVPADTVVIHGEVDDVVPLAATLAWARPQSLPVIVLPGVGHFFHGQLALLRSVIVRELQPRVPL